MLLTTRLLWAAVGVPPTADQVITWSAIAIGAVGFVIAVIKGWNHLNERWVSQKQYDKDQESLKHDLAAYKEQIAADTERNDKLINKLEALTRAIEGCSFRKK